MHARWAGIALAAVVAALSAAPAQAATLTVDTPCYRAAEPAGDLVLAGGGFTPGGLVLIGSGDTTIDSAVADAKGNFRLKYPIPAPPQTGKHAHEAQFTFTATDSGDATLTAAVTFSTANVFGDYNPGTSLHPETTRVRFSAFGFAVGLPATAARPKVYVHYVSPKGKVAKTALVGTATGVCGSIKATALRRLFPFAPARGRWTLQFDTRKVYKRGVGSRFLYDRSLTLTIS